MKDKLQRPLHDLRISVIDRCNFRCPYCMPADSYDENYGASPREKILSFEEIERLTRLFVQLGAKKIRLTGGEPLLRKNLSKLVKQLSNIDGFDDLTLTTNGALLSEHATDLKRAGLMRLTVSLDALDARTFKHTTGHRGVLQNVLDGIKAAEESEFDSLKINAVIQRGVNEQSVLELVEHFRHSPHVLRFIEYMDVGNCNHWEQKYVVPSKEIFTQIHAKYPLKSLDPQYYGEVAARYAYEDGAGEIGFISSISQPFCQSCSRARLSTDGKLYTCLFATEGTDLRTPLRNGASDEELLSIIQNTWRKREDRYSELRTQTTPQKSNPKKIEMFQIGG